MPDLCRHLPQPQEFQGILLTPTVFNQIDRAERTLAEGLLDAVSSVDDVSRLEVTSVHNLIGRTHFLFRFKFESPVTQDNDVARLNGHLTVCLDIGRAKFTVVQHIPLAILTDQFSLFL